MKKTLFFLFTELFCIYAGAQTSVTGIISDQNNIPLPGVTIYIPELNKGTISNSDGQYSIINLPKGKTLIQFSFIGFNTQIETIFLEGRQNVLNIVLSDAVIQTQAVVVTGGIISSQHQNAVKIDVLQSREIFLSGTPNFMQALTAIPGVDMVSRGQGVSKPVIRGLSMNDILILNNGVRIENYQFSENHPLGIDDNEVDIVEVIKGPASLLYGSDAVGGVINFIKGKPAPVGTVSGDFQTQIHSNTYGFNNSLGIKGSSKFFYAGFRVSEKSHEDYKQGGGGYVPNSRFNELSLNSNVGFTGKKIVSRIMYDYFAQKLGMTVPPAVALITEAARKNEIWYQDLNYHCLSTQTKVFFGRYKWETSVAGQMALRKMLKTLDIPSVDMKLSTLTYESKLVLPSNESSQYVIGIQGLSQINRNQNNRPEQFLPNADIHNLGVIAFAQRTFLKKLNLQGGMRFDLYRTETFSLGTLGAEGYHKPVTKDFSSLNGSVGTTYNLNEKFMLRANLAKAYRVPNLSELTSNGEHGSRFEIGNEFLNPENAYECDISMHYHGKFFSYDLAGFYNQINDYIYISPTGDTSSTNLNIYRFSQTDSRLYGGEAVIHFHPERVPWLHCKAVYSNVTGQQVNGDFLPFIPAQKFRYEIRAGKEKIAFFKQTYVWVSALTALRQKTPSPFETETSSYTLVNAGANTELSIGKQTMSVGISINNVFDNLYFDHLSLLKPLRFFNQGRNISLAIKIPFQIKNIKQSTI